MAMTTNLLVNLVFTVCYQCHCMRKAIDLTVAHLYYGARQDQVAPEIGTTTATARLLLVWRQRFIC